MIEHFAEIYYCWKPLTIFPKHSNFDVWHCSEYAFDALKNSIPEHPKFS